MIPAAEYCNHFYTNSQRDIYGAVRGSAVFKVTLRETTYNNTGNAYNAYKVCIFYRDPTKEEGYSCITDYYDDDYEEAKAAYRKALRTYHFIEEDDDNA